MTTPDGDRSSRVTAARPGTDDTPNRPTAERCRCRRPLTPPEGQHWWPHRDPEPGPEVRVVVVWGDKPHVLRSVRVEDGWHAQGFAAPYPEHTPPEPWTATGRCGAGSQHPVVDATYYLAPQLAAQDPR